MKRRKLNKKGKRTIALSSIFGFAIIIIVIFGLINNYRIQLALQFKYKKNNIKNMLGKEV